MIESAFGNLSIIFFKMFPWLEPLKFEAETNLKGFSICIATVVIFLIVIAYSSSKLRKMDEQKRFERIRQINEQTYQDLNDQKYDL